MSKYPKSEYSNTQNMSTRQQNEAKYLQSEYSHTHNTSMAGKLIRGTSRADQGDACGVCGEEIRDRG